MVNIRIHLTDGFLLLFFLMRDQQMIEELLHYHSCGIYIRWHSYIWFMMWCTWKAPVSQSLKTAVLKGDVTDTKCNLASDHDQQIIETDNSWKQVGGFFFCWFCLVLFVILFLTEVLPPRAGSHEALSSCSVIRRWPNDTKQWATDVLFTLTI